ncbi:hypothetical protein XENTR_v10012152 [Xenopus tropicalis]|nr:hypothetical protein XENTR_v10012152 [Xenopus tropicalis]
MGAECHVLETFLRAGHMCVTSLADYWELGTGCGPLLEWMEQLWLLVVLAVLCLLALLLALRVWLVLRQGVECRPGRKGCVSLMVVAGSGGHTTEILRLLSSLSKSYSPTHYVLAETDKMSEDKIHLFENTRTSGVYKSTYSIHRIPRSREVRQSWSSSFLTTLQSMLYSFPLTARLQPDLVCIAVFCTVLQNVHAAFIVKLYFILDNMSVFSENKIK